VLCHHQPSERLQGFYPMPRPTSFGTSQFRDQDLHMLPVYPTTRPGMPQDPIRLHLRTPGAKQGATHHSAGGLVIRSQVCELWSCPCRFSGQSIPCLAPSTRTALGNRAIASARDSATPLISRIGNESAVALVRRQASGILSGAQKPGPVRSGMVF